jgi:hypothetical protein
MFGAAILLDIAVHLLRPPTVLSRADYFEQGLTIVSIMLIWFLYRWLLRELNRMSGKVEEHTLDRIAQIGFSMAFLGYLMLPLPLVLIHHH